MAETATLPCLGRLILRLQMQMKVLNLSKMVGMLGSQALAVVVHHGGVWDKTTVVLGPAVATLEEEGEVGVGQVASTSIPDLTSDMLCFLLIELAGCDLTFLMYSSVILLY
jgi:hypothetical protein